MLAQQVPPIEWKPALQPEDLHFHYFVGSGDMRTWCISPKCDRELAEAFEAVRNAS
jgi:hypothetical protein